MRILLSVYSCNPEQGSEPGVGWNWAVALADRGHDVVALTRTRNQKAISAALRKLQVAGSLTFVYHETDRFAGHATSGVTANLAYASWQRTVLSIARAVDEETPFDLVHHLTFGSWRQPSLLWTLGRPFVFGPVGGGEEAPWNLVPLLGPKAALTEGLRAAINRVSLANGHLRRCIANSRYLFAKTPETSRMLSKLGGRSTVALEIGITADPAPRVRALDGVPRLLFVGRLIGWKGATLAIEAVAQAHADGNPVTLSIVGSGPLRPHLQAQIDALGLGTSINLRGAVDFAQMPGVYAQHDMFLFPSLHDSSGNVVLEAHAAGLPVICLDCGGPKEIITPQSGIAVPTTGSQRQVAVRLAGAIRTLQDSATYVSASRAALGRAQALSWKNAVAGVYTPIEKDLGQ